MKIRLFQFVQPVMTHMINVVQSIYHSVMMLVTVLSYKINALSTVAFALQEDDDQLDSIDQLGQLNQLANKQHSSRPLKS